MKGLALLSVSDKSGIVELGKKLVEEFDFQIVSSGGTAKTLQSAGIPVTKVSDYTGAPEILGGRVKTLHPRIHGGILANLDLESHQEDLEANNITAFDVVVVNLYPFEKTVAQDNCTLADAIEQIDIGGPAMVRASAKNYHHVTILSNPASYDEYLQQLRDNNGKTTLEFRQKRAMEAFAMTAAYDQAICRYFAQVNPESANYYGIGGNKIATLRYGENPHQKASWYQSGNEATGWASAQQLQGKELSYNNLVDLEAARRIVCEFPSDTPAAVVIKHTNPCGVATGETLATAYNKAYNADSVSAFGGIVALNQPIDAPTATAMSKIFLECIVAPDCTDEAKAILGKKSNLRVLLLSDLNSGSQDNIKAIAGGFLIQENDLSIELPDSWQVVTEKQPTQEDLKELLFAWKVVKHVKSNAIAITKNCTTLGIGAGQMNRVGSVKIALEQAQNEAQGAYLASDAFFPFDDSVRTCGEAGIKAIIQPGGSIRDEDSIKAANELGLVMVFTGVRHFLH
ncbi:bifunctional phosphoribosylaminoimidazolecarboxamide formyltransferase/IMP cyclohydrolase [Cyanobacterium sp. Dongsha4]|uniref:bifunctional phosphoribosylaminoimidazolecarboxamide formyltransferase/IMP cyclohydrolase n=1 Tax=Cyanobacterium sp. DS4 TaxID=2878255 RepID=UPI002E81E16B|nr:bifunctional phosphoribosylaminoimidazolecarboxamide formyltransferase/IMP cyclohydrolase [Cyanobacterium sp. Dongsha4]WVL00013.1 bifunctional phosphoribosylaminoimidazolecarboxamide formyltransferase/IMP cyclohydrolase [Cyanobacterium sp. Dongsha4]